MDLNQDGFGSSRGVTRIIGTGTVPGALLDSYFQGFSSLGVARLIDQGGDGNRKSGVWT